jgi:hypothetical protein
MEILEIWGKRVLYTQVALTLAQPYALCAITLTQLYVLCALTLKIVRRYRRYMRYIRYRDIEI